MGLGIVKQDNIRIAFELQVGAPQGQCLGRASFAPHLLGAYCGDEWFFQAKGDPLAQCLVHAGVDGYGSVVAGVPGIALFV